MAAKQAAEELGVRYIVEGSVKRAGDRVRVTTQLVDTLTRSVLWSERYDRTTETSSPSRKKSRPDSS